MPTQFPQTHRFLAQPSQTGELGSPFPVVDDDPVDSGEAERIAGRQLHAGRRLREPGNVRPGGLQRALGDALALTQGALRVVVGAFQPRQPGQFVLGVGQLEDQRVAR